MSNFNHKGVEISIDKSGKFTAKVGGQLVKKSSLDAIRKAIDGANIFEPFKALRLAWGSRVEEIVIVGIANSRKAYGARLKWRTEGGGEYDAVYASTPENRAALEAYLTRCAEDKKESDRRQELRQAMLDAVAEMRPEPDKAPA